MSKESLTEWAKRRALRVTARERTLLAAENAHVETCVRFWNLLRQEVREAVEVFNEEVAAGCGYVDLQENEKDHAFDIGEAVRVWVESSNLTIGVKHTIREAETVEHYRVHVTRRKTIKAVQGRVQLDLTQLAKRILKPIFDEHQRRWG